MSPGYVVPSWRIILPANVFLQGVRGGLDCAGTDTRQLEDDI